MGKTVEQRVSDAVLQKPIEVEIGNKTYKVAPPSVATLILASAAISRLPAIKLDNDNIAVESLYVARDCEVLGEIVAIFILGAKGVKGSKKALFGLRKIEVDEKSLLAKEILENATPKQISELLTQLLVGMQLSFFFATTVSLIEINLLRKTREAETTVSGQ
jgi:hypothetical protein